MNSFEKYVRFRYSRRICARLKLYRIFELATILKISISWFLEQCEQMYISQTCFGFEQLGEKHIFLESKPLNQQIVIWFSFTLCVFFSSMQY